MEAQNAAEAALQRDLRGTNFLLGVEDGRWRLHNLTFPFLYIEVAAPRRPAAPDWYSVRFECSTYPGAVRGVFWDFDRNAELEPASWPRLDMDQAFRADWPGANEAHVLYVACDAETMRRKPGWESEHRLEWWRAGSDITLYLGVISDRLHSSRYIGSGRTPRAA